MSSTSPPIAPERTNNFDLIRILAAAQVAIIHGHEHLDLAPYHPSFAAFAGILRYLPGVPVFFTVSGFLITWSFDRTPDLRVYARNRFLRIYPALWATLLLTITLLAVHGFLTRKTATSVPVLGWLIGQLTFAQFYTPSAFRPYGMGNPNGALWTIPVEVQFYCILPFFVRALKRSRRLGNVVIILAAALSLTANIIIGHIDEHDIRRKLLHQTLIPWLFYFAFGMLAYANWSRAGRFFRGKAAIWACVFVTYSALTSGWLGLYSPSYWPNLFGLIAAFLLSGATLSCAFSHREMAHRLLRGNDYSYGLYVLHCVVLNVLIYHHVIRTLWAELAMLVCSIGLALLSWTFVERPALRLKQVRRAA